MYLTALLADDNDLSLMVCEELLSEYKLRTHTAVSGAEAVRLAAAYKFDIIFLDHIMPGMDGAETCRRIRRIEGYADTPIIALTGNDTQQYEALYHEVGMSDWMTKPMEPDVLHGILTKWLKNLKPSAEDSKAAQPDVPQWYTELSAIKQLDARRALGLMRGNYQALRRMLDAFTRQVEQKTLFMEDAIGRGNLKPYAVEAHSFKGSLNNMGATTMAERARELELLADAGDLEAVRHKNAALMWGLRALAKIIADTRPSENAAKKRGDNNDLLDTLKKIADAMEEFETDDAKKLVMGLRTFGFSAEYDKRVFELGELLDAYEFDAFVTETASLIGELGG
ncbi:hypothetical protein FACS1894217_00270 [Clostridia bacterium]|nr:hypothetical protein FACS1894217_00270 [Clostridia bacterium]